MIVLYELLQIHGSQQHLPPINRYKSRNRVLVANHARSLHTSAQFPVANVFTRSCPHVSEGFFERSEGHKASAPGKELESFADGQATRLLSQRATVFKPATTRSLVAESAHH